MLIRVPKKTQEHLEWDRIRQALANYCRSSMAHDAALELLPSEDRTTLKDRLDLTSDTRHLIDAGHSLPMGQPIDVRRLLRLAARQGVLDPDALIEIRSVIEASGRCHKYLEEIMSTATSLGKFIDNLVALPDLESELRTCFNERGEVSNAASGEIFDLRHRVDGLHSQLKEVVQGLVSDPQYEGMLQDEYYTIREDRYVLPIRSGHKNHIDGIVHGWSGSGATVFIEPQRVVEANNRLVFAQAEVDREVRRILTRLSKQVGQKATEIEDALNALAELDFAWACGELSASMQATRPQISKQPDLALKQARHPILVAGGGIKLVPNDLVLDADRRVLILTGPNTGGKTVALKTAGLCTLMGLSGLHIPAESESTIPWAPAIFSDIGDEQSLDSSLSTFSGHIANLRSIFNGTRPGTMILLDELVVGTDPIQGAALAQAILEEFANRNAMVIVTTHYENLKILPYTDDRFRNGAMGFDPDTGHPTYRLALDAPGASSALQTARRLGLDEGIVERAGELAGPDQRALQTVIEDLERERDTLHRLRVDAQEEFNRHQVARAAFEAREKTLKERLKKGLQSERGGALDDARKLRNELVSIRKSIRRKVTAKDTEWLAAAQKQAEEVISDVTKSRADEQRELAGPELDPGTLEIGQSVWVVSLGHEAVIEELPDSKGRCHVRAGPLAVQVSAADLRSRRHGKSEKKKTSAHRGTKPTPDVQGWDDVSPQIPDNTVDLRGLRVDEALERLEKFLDDCYGRDMGSAFVIHGHGTGALKREVREWLRTSRYVREQRRGGRYEGGDGVTAVLLQS